MVPISALWLPILLAAVLVFLASSILHMVLTYHRTDFRALPNEDHVTGALRGERLAPGEYRFPYAATGKEMNTPAMMEKYRQGPVGFVTVLPSGAPALGKHLAQWFVYSLAVGVVVAYVTGRAVGPGTEYLEVFRLSGTTAWLAYAGAQPAASIWRGQPWSVTLKNLIDGLVYGLVTAGAFGWLWPRG